MRDSEQVGREGVAAKVSGMSPRRGGFRVSGNRCVVHCGQKGCRCWRRKGEVRLFEGQRRESDEGLYSKCRVADQRQKPEGRVVLG